MNFEKQSTFKNTRNTSTSITWLRWRMVHHFSVFCTYINRLVLRQRPHHYTFNDLKKLPKNTVGHHVYQQLSSAQLSYQPKLLFHDAKHVILGYSMQIQDELRLNAFLLGNRSVNPLGLIYLAICCSVVPEFIPQLKKAFQRGKQSNSLKSMQFSTLINQPLHLVITLISSKQTTIQNHS